MSIATGLALIIGGMLVVWFLYFYLSTHANRYGNQILTGLVQGVPVSTEYRLIMLYYHWSGFACGAVAVAFFGVMLNWTIAVHAPHADLERLAYLFAFMSGMGAIGWLASAFVEFVHYRSVLREAKST